MTAHRYPWLQRLEDRLELIRAATARARDEDDTGPGHDGPPPPEQRRRRRVEWPDWGDNDA